MCAYMMSKNSVTLFQYCAEQFDEKQLQSASKSMKVFRDQDLDYLALKIETMQENLLTLHT